MFGWGEQRYRFSNGQAWTAKKFAAEIDRLLDQWRIRQGEVDLNVVYDLRRLIPHASDTRLLAEHYDNLGKPMVDALKMLIETHPNNVANESKLVRARELIGEIRAQELGDEPLRHTEERVKDTRETGGYRIGDGQYANMREAVPILPPTNEEAPVSFKIQDSKYAHLRKPLKDSGSHGIS